MKYIVRTALLLFALSSVVAGCGGGDVVLSRRMEALLGDVDASLLQRERIVGQRAAEMAMLRDSLAHAVDYGAQAALYGRLAEAAHHYQLDSALCYHAAARRCALAYGDSTSADRHAIAVLPILTLTQGADEALSALAAVDTASLGHDNKVELHRAAIRVYVNLLMADRQGAADGEYLRLAGRNARWLLEVPGETDSNRLYSAVADMAEGRMSLAIASLRDYLSAASPSAPGYADANCLLALAYRMKGDSEAMAYCIGLLALAESNGGSRDGWALGHLASLALEMGDPQRAYSYLLVAQENARDSGALAVAAKLTEIAPAVGSEYRAATDRAAMGCRLAIGGLVAVLVAVGIVAYRLWRSRRALLSAYQRLSDANGVKEACLGRFLKLSHTYMEKLEEVGKIVTRKLAAGQIEELYHMARASKTVEEQRQLLYKEFDEAFMQAFPTFVADVNGLMREGCEIVQPTAGRMTPELRILAFMRLGVEDSEMVARFLGVSVTTVYAYRTRLKNRAADRDAFEADVAKIGR